MDYILFAYFVVEAKSKNYRQTHKMEHMLFASVIKSFLTKELHKKIMKFVVNLKNLFLVLRFIIPLGV